MHYRQLIAAKPGSFKGDLLSFWSNRGSEWDLIDHVRKINLILK